MFEKVREKTGGGGILTAVHSNLDPVLVDTHEDDNEIIVVEGKLGSLTVRFINAYGPQEEESGGDAEKIKSFYSKLDLVIKEAIFAEVLICIEMDANAKLGQKTIPNDPKPMSRNGEKLLAIIEENGLIVMNFPSIVFWCNNKSKGNCKFKRRECA